jgi:DNA invertase Pin-like site-specific DNA recombinase
MPVAVGNKLGSRARHVETYGQIGAKLSFWEINRKRGERLGNTTLLVRKSSDDNGFIGAANQMQEVLKAVDRAEGLDAQWIILVTQCSGARWFETRPDLLKLVEIATTFPCQYIAARDITRLSRSPQGFLDIKSYTDSANLSIYLAWTGRVFNRDDMGDVLAAAIGTEFAAYEREQTRQRTMSGTHDRRFAAGKGASCAPPVGFKKNEDGYWVQDPDEWWKARLALRIRHALATNAEPDKVIAQLIKEETGRDFPIEAIRAARLGKKP